MKTKPENQHTAATNQSPLDDSEAGLVTAEYAVGIVTAVAFAGLLLAIIRSDSVRQMLLNILQTALGTGI